MVTLLAYIAPGDGASWLGRYYLNKPDESWQAFATLKAAQEWAEGFAVVDDFVDLEWTIDTVAGNHTIAFLHGTPRA